MRATRESLHLVGSMPFDAVEECLRVCGNKLGGFVVSLPDGEVGERWDWTGYLSRHVFSGHPALEERKATGAVGALVSGDRSLQAAENPDVWSTFRLKPSTEDFEIRDLWVGDVAVESYKVFQRLRDAGEIPKAVRFQVCFPGSSSAVEPFFHDPHDWPVAKRAYEAAISDEIAHICEVIPAADLAIQFDLCYEIMDLTLGETDLPLPDIPHAPKQTLEQKLQRHTRQLSTLWRSVPDEARFGYHWCYGTWGGWPMTDMNDLKVCVALSNHAVATSDRRVDYVHIPVPQHPDPNFFADLRELNIGDTDVYLGVVHVRDGLLGCQNRVRLARNHLGDFGLGGVCGFGRDERARADSIVTVLRECAAWLAGDQQRGGDCDWAR